jgi:type I restriction enzyme S subunit
VKTTDWKQTRLGHELELLYGKGLPASARIAGDVPVYGSNGIVGFHNKFLVEGPGIIVGRKGSVGEVAFSHRPFWPIDTTYYMSNRGGNDWRFLYFLLQHLQLTGLNSHSTVPGLNRESVYSIELAFPPKFEQEKIAAVLCKIQKAVEIEDAIVRNARDLKKSLLRCLFTHGLRGEPLKETEIGPLPKNWEVRTFASVASLERGRFLHRPRNEPRFYGGNAPFVQTGDVVRSNGRVRDYSQTLNEEGVKISRIFPAGTILITIAANIGYSGILEFDSACPDSLIGITSREVIEGEYLLYYLQTQQSRMDTLAPRGTQKNINIQFLSPWPVAFPPKDEQREIAHILKTVDHKIDIHESKKRSLQELFKTMLHKLMTAQIRVNHLDIDTREVETR